jgi:hypothetical protein
MPKEAQRCERHVSKVSHVNHLNGEVGEDVQQVTPPAADSSMAAIPSSRSLS